MKTLAKSVLILALISMCCQSCFKKPEAAFSYKPVENPEAGEEIEFTNESLDAKDFYWDFGNEQSSEEEMPSNKYLLPGTYTVTLVAENLFHADSISENILIYPATILEFYYYDYDGNPIPAAAVELYGSYNDATQGRNVLRSGTTNTAGMVKFSNLEEQEYYFYMFKSAVAGYYVSSLYVGPLKLNVINSYYAYVEFTTGGNKKGSLKDNYYPAQKTN